MLSNEIPDSMQWSDEDVLESRGGFVCGMLIKFVFNGNAIKLVGIPSAGGSGACGYLRFF